MCKTHHELVNALLMAMIPESLLQADEFSRAARQLAVAVEGVDPFEVFGRVMAVRGLLIEIAGPISAMGLGSAIDIETAPGKVVPCEIVGFEGGRALAMPFAGLEGVRRGCRALVQAGRPGVRPSMGWLGRVINAAGEPIDGKGPLPGG
jgi:flagellum-specific ATP synthase